MMRLGSRLLVLSGRLGRLTGSRLGRRLLVSRLGRRLGTFQFTRSDTRFGDGLLGGFLDSLLGCLDLLLNEFFSLGQLGELLLGRDQILLSDGHSGVDLTLHGSQSLGCVAVCSASDGQQISGGGFGGGVFGFGHF